MPAAAPCAPHETYVSNREVMRILGCDHGTVVRLGTDGHIKVRQVPGCPRRYCLADALKLAEPKPTGG